MWIKCPNGVDTLVHNPDHIARLLAAGGIEISDPTAKHHSVNVEVSAVAELHPTTEVEATVVEVNETPVKNKGGRPPKKT